MTHTHGNKRTKKSPLVSIIIPTFNSEKTLPYCLQSLKDQTYSNIEVIIVDRYSSDDTSIIAKRFDTKILYMDCERSAARNYGVENARGLFVFFVDSDMELTPKVVEECVTLCLNKDADAIVISELSIGRGFLSKCRKLEKNHFIGNKMIENPRFFKKEVFLSIGKYDEKLSFGEDSDLYLRIKRNGYKIMRAKSKIKHNEGTLTLKKIVSKAYYYGKTIPVFISKHPSFAMKKHSPLNQIYISNVKLFLTDPIHFLGITFIKIIEYISYTIGILAYLIFKK